MSRRTTIPAGQHLELWARTQYDDIVRVNGYYDLGDGKTANGLMIRQAISLNDPCMIDGYYFAGNGNGNLLTSPAAYPSSVTQAGVTQTAADQAQQVIDRINQLDRPRAPRPAAGGAAVRSERAAGDSRHGDVADRRAARRCGTRYAKQRAI